jgi:type III pantothenate kinase
VVLLAIDIGNSNIVFGVYRGKELIAHWRVATEPLRTTDEFAMLLSSLFAHQGLGLQEVQGAIIASVVPPLTPVFQELCQRYLARVPLVVGTGIKTGVRIRTDNPREVGADRVVNALAAHRLYGGPVIVIDFGTATTFDAVSKEGDYLGGAIAPGIDIAAEALYRRTAKLPRIELVPPPRAIGTNTVHAMQSGLVLGYVGLVEGLVGRLRLELGEGTRVVATGGLATAIAKETRLIEAVNPQLTLEGLRMIWELNNA